MSEQSGLRVLLAVDGSVHSEAAVNLTARITWPACTIVHALAVVPELWLLSGPRWNPGREQQCATSAAVSPGAFAFDGIYPLPGDW